MSKRRSALLSKTTGLGLMLLLASLLAACGDKAKSDADLIADITADARATQAARPGPGTPGGFTSVTIRPALSPEATAAVTTASSDSGPAVKVGVTTGSAAPEINVVDIDKKVFRLSDFRNSKAVLLNFWGVDWIYCRQESPDLAATFKKNSQDLVILGINIDTSSEKDVREFMAQAGITYPVFMDISQKQARLFRITGTPHSVFINRKGIITSVRSGLMTVDTIEAELQKALK